MIVKLLTEHLLEFLSLKEGCRGSSESKLVKMPLLLEISCTGTIIIIRRSKAKLEMTLMKHNAPNPWHIKNSRFITQGGHL